MVINKCLFFNVNIYVFFGVFFLVFFLFFLYRVVFCYVFFVCSWLVISYSFYIARALGLFHFFSLFGGGRRRLCTPR